MIKNREKRSQDFTSQLLCTCKYTTNWSDKPGRKKKRDCSLNEFLHSVADGKVKGLNKIEPPDIDIVNRVLAEQCFLSVRSVPNVD